MKRCKLWINGDEYVWIYILDGGERLELGKAWDAPMQRDDEVGLEIGEHGVNVSLRLKVDEVEEL